MNSSLVHGRYLITNDDQNDYLILENGALYQDNGRIEAVGPYTEIRARYPNAEVLGGPEFLVFPGFINAHHHGSGFSSSQQGLAEGSLEYKLFRGIARRRLDPYLNTLYACAKMIESGVTCSLHHAYAGGDPEAYVAAMERALRAHEEAGIRVAMAIAARDQNTLVYQADDRFLQGLPADLRHRTADFLTGHDLPRDEYLAIFRELHGRYRQSNRVRILLGPAGLQWCSDGLLTSIAETARDTGSGIHLHAAESPYQKEYPLRKFDRTVVSYLRDLGILGPQTSCAHSVWVNEEDLEILADTGTSVVHNPSSNLRSGVGIAPVAAMWQRGVNVALGMDGSALNDDDDMLQEIRLCLRLHRPIGLAASHLTVPQAFAMATANGARVALFANEIGQIAIDRRADLVLMRFEHIGPESLIETLGVVEALLLRGKARDIDTVMIDGQIVLKDGELTGIDKQALLAELTAQAELAPTAEEKERAQVISELEPFMLDFYRDWAVEDGQPFYLLNSRD